MEVGTVGTPVARGEAGHGLGGSFPDYVTTSSVRCACEQWLRSAQSSIENTDHGSMHKFCCGDLGSKIRAAVGTTVARVLHALQGKLGRNGAASSITI